MYQASRELSQLVRKISVYWILLLTPSMENTLYLQILKTASNGTLPIHVWMQYIHNSSQHASIIVSLIRACFVSIGQVLPPPISWTIKLAPLYRRDAQDMPMPDHCADTFEISTTSDKASLRVYPSDPHFLRAFKLAICVTWDKIKSSI